jgi:3-oxoacyl-[acyl-carrier protein] reductase
MSDDLEGKVAIVTGGAQGIGRAICHALTREGAQVVIADINRDCAQETANMLSRQKALVVRADIASETSIKDLFAQVLTQCGHVDIVVNNAGICLLTPILEISAEEWDRMMQINLRGTFLMCQQAVRVMMDAGGKIINIASVAGKVGGIVAGAHYAASKAGVICLTKSFAGAVAQYKINVNAICPGQIDTPLTAAWSDDIHAAILGKIPWGTYGQPEDIAEAVTFLASQRAQFITGEILDVNGGLLMD